MVAKLRVTQVKSTISHIARNRATVRALGLHRIGDTVEVTDNDATRGMVRQVRFLVRFEEVDTPEAKVKPRTTRTTPAEPASAPAPRRSASRAATGKGAPAPAKETE